MYIPPAFAVTDRTRLFDFIEAHSFGLLLSNLAGGLFATHLPLLVEREGGERGRLVGHMARANPQWRELAGQEVLAVFSGPHAYISPTWYGADNVVPTWNYVAVHVYGTCEMLVDPAATARIVQDYVTTYERALPKPWTVDPTTPFFERLTKLIVGFRVEISRIEGKWKLGQNHPQAMRAGAARHLAESVSDDARAVARWMAETLGQANG